MTQIYFGDGGGALYIMCISVFNQLRTPLIRLIHELQRFWRVTETLGGARVSGVSGALIEGRAMEGFTALTRSER